MTPGDELLFLALGGSGEIGMNLNLYGCRGKWVMVDLGVTFGDPNCPGIDLVMPDTAFLEEHRDDLLGIVLTHGHEDHIGAIPYLALDLGVPLYATKFTAGLIRDKLNQEGLEEKVKLHVIREGDQFTLGAFGFRYVPLAHSIPRAMRWSSTRRSGAIFHTGDWKLDDEPILGVPATADELTAIGDSGRAGDGLRQHQCVQRAGERDGRLGQGRAARIRARRAWPRSGHDIRLQRRAAPDAGRRGARNRTQAVRGGALARPHHRHGQKLRLSRRFPRDGRHDDVMDLPARDVMVIATGGQGEPRAALARIAFDAHPIQLGSGDVVISSSRQIPGKRSRHRPHPECAGRQECPHDHRAAEPYPCLRPSGRPELKAMYGWIRPEIIVPVHGELRHMAEQARFAASNGIRRGIVQTNGDVIRLAPDGPEKLTEVHHGRLVLDGDVILPADGITMNDRRKLMLHGHNQRGLRALKGPDDRQADIRMKGVPIEEDREAFLEEAHEALFKAMRTASRKADIEALRETARLAVRRVANDWTGKKPIVDVTIVQL